MPVILWDELKRAANLQKHGLDFGLLTETFFEDAVFTPAKLGRFAAMNRIGARTITVIFAPYGEEGVSVVSMRPSSHVERRIYEQEKAKRI